MTALAGVLTLTGDAAFTAGVELMLAAQIQYATLPPAYVTTPQAIVGRALYPLLAEDRFDVAPQTSGDGAWLCVADVRLDNRAALAVALDISTDALTPICDAALVLAAWQRWGLACFDRLRGDFAIAIVDVRHSRLILARDFLGQRPLFYRRHEDWVGFASMPSGLSALPPVTATIDRQALADYLKASPGRQTRSCLDGIAPVPPGHWLAIDINGVGRHRFWTPPPPGTAAGDRSERTLAARRLFDAAIDACLRDATVVASHLSGGLDSGAVTVAAARRLAGKQPLYAYTATLPAGCAVAAPRGRFVDEAPLAMLSAAQAGNISHCPVAADSDALSARWDEAVALFQSPLPNPCNYRWAATINDVARAQGVSTMLTGQMGNLSISYQTPHHSSRSDWASPRLWLRAIRRIGRLVRSRWSAMLGRHSLPHFSRTAKAPDEQPLDSRPARSSYDARIDALDLFDFGVFNKGILAGWGIDMRDPTANRDLVDYCLSLPDGDFADPGVDRALAKRAFADLLPATVLNETKRGLQSADWRWAMRRDRDRLLAQIDAVADDETARSLIDLSRLRAVVAEMGDVIALGQADEALLRRGALRAVAACHFIRTINIDRAA